MRWLHLSDIHTGRLGDENHRVAIESLVDCIESATREAVDAVFFTGDLAYSGIESEYETFTNLLLNRLRALPSLRDARWIAVPGNHDLDCSSVLPTPWKSLGGDRQSKFFQNNDAGRKIRAPRAIGFEKFAHFLTNNNIDGVDPTNLCSRVIDFQSGSVPVKLFCLNTAYFSDKDISDELSAPAPTLALRSHQSKSADDDVLRIVLGHHPIHWFLHESQEPFKSWLMDTKAVYLHGHLHEVKASFSREGLQSLGFGAVYQAAMDNTTSSIYRNGFALCECDASWNLHVVFYAWDHQYGKWRKNNNLPNGFEKESSVLNGGYVLQLPKVVRRRKGADVDYFDTSRLLVSKLVSFGTLSRNTWEWLLKSLKLLPNDVQLVPIFSPHHQQFRYQSKPGSSHRILCISGHGHMLSAREIENENTKFDTEEYESLTIVTLGDMATDARTLAALLQKRKPFIVKTCVDVAASLQEQSGKFADHLQSLSLSQSEISWIISDVGMGILVADKLRASWFYTLTLSGEQNPESSALVRKLRSESSSLAKAQYGMSHDHGGSSDAHTVNLPTPLEFNRQLYSDACRTELGSLKYDPLAVFGMKLPNTKLSDVYVPASADVSDLSHDTVIIRQAINDLLDAFRLDDSQRKQIEMQLREGADRSPFQETGAARDLYQKYNSIIVLGDPGSGKTCFVKSELLAYCTVSNKGSWYERHVPLFIPLSEAAALHSSGLDLLEICATVAARQGLPIDLNNLKKLVSDGNIAFFFDGIDEIPSVQLRSELVKLIGELIDSASSKGSRFVLTSRPAAVQLIEVPKGLHALQLRGLTDVEIKSLATNLVRVMNTVVGESSPATERDDNLVKRLIDDCNVNPGIKRIARNPLLLTLLVMIYANSGPSAAKRHRVYAQAVQTLVSVRNRSLKLPVISEADLRRRLGFVALSLYKQQNAEIPSKKSVELLIEQALRHEEKTGNLQIESAIFLQQVAEQTGLLVIHQRADNLGGPTVSFLHHSFLEYYAAIGYLEYERTLENMESIQKLAVHPRWREVISIMSGIIGDQSNVTQFIARLLESRRPADIITEDMLLFVIDCALECDVPPEETQRIVVGAIDRSVRHGAALIDPELRKELGERLEKLFFASGSVYVRNMLLSGIREADPQVAAAFIDLTGRSKNEDPVLTKELLRLIADQKPKQGSNSIATEMQRYSVIKIALLSAIERIPSLRSEDSVKFITACLNSSQAVKYVALHVVEKVPAIAPKVTEGLRKCLESGDPSISFAAARAMLVSGVLSDFSKRSRTVLRQCLMSWERFAGASDVSQISFMISRRNIDQMLTSPESDERVLGIRLLPWMQREENYVQDRLSEIFHNHNASNDELRAALSSLRLSISTSAFIRLRDSERIRQLANTTSRDVRIAAFRVLACLNYDPEIVELFLGRAKKVNRYSDWDEWANILKCAVAHTITNRPFSNDSLVRDFICGESLKELGRIRRTSIGNKDEQNALWALLGSCQQLGRPFPVELEGHLISIISDHRVPTKIRQHAMKTLALVAKPSENIIKIFIGFLRSGNPTLSGVVGDSIQMFVNSCRQDVDDVRRISNNLHSLEDALVERWLRSGLTHTEEIDDVKLRGIRCALKDVRELIVSFDEFANLKKVELRSSST